MVPCRHCVIRICRDRHGILVGDFSSGSTRCFGNYQYRSLSIFFAMIMLGRLLCGFVVQRAGYLRSIFFASLGGLFCIAIGLFIPRRALFFLPFTGFFLSIIFPTITAAVSDSKTENINTLLGVLFTFAGIGGVFGPWLIGWGSDLFGLQAGFAINLLLAGLTFISILILIKSPSTRVQKPVLPTE